MKKLTLIFSSAVLLGLASCASKENMSQKELNNYIDSVKKVNPEYTDTYWTSIDEGYKVREAKAAAAANDEARKKELEKSRADYEELKTKYQAEVQKNKEQAYNNKKQALRDALFGEGKIGTDMSFSWVTAQNIKDVYVSFVNTVADNKKTYSREDWDEIKVLYEALDTRKNEVEKELSSKDNMKIAKEKIRFASIETVERPLAKMSENSEAKKMDQ
jgi:beta-xylosidase